MNVVERRELPQAAGALRIIALPAAHSAGPMIRVAQRRDWLGESTIPDEPALQRLPWYRSAERIVDAAVTFRLNGEECRLVPGERALTESLELVLTILTPDTGCSRHERRPIEYGITTSADEAGEVGLARTVDSSPRVMTDILMDAFGYTHEQASQLDRAASQVNRAPSAGQDGSHETAERIRQALAWVVDNSTRFTVNVGRGEIAVSEDQSRGQGAMQPVRHEQFQRRRGSGRRLA